MSDSKWMTQAIEYAERAQVLDEVPVGAVLVKDEKLIAAAHNAPIGTNDPTGHAEIRCLRLGGDILNNYRLLDCTLYVTLEPCAMCAGAMIHARIKRLVFGAYDSKTGVASSVAAFFESSYLNHNIKVDGGVKQEACKAILQDFFKRKRMR